MFGAHSVPLRNVLIAMAISCVQAGGRQGGGRLATRDLHCWREQGAAHGLSPWRLGCGGQPAVHCHTGWRRPAGRAGRAGGPGMQHTHTSHTHSRPVCGRKAARLVVRQQL